MSEQSSIAASPPTARMAKFTARAAGLLLVALSALPNPAFAASAADYVGRWMNFSHDSSGITGLTVQPTRNGLSVQVYGLCRGQDVCDWNTVDANLYSLETNRWSDNSWGRNWSGFNWFQDNSWTRDADYVTATIDAGYARKFIILRRDSGNQLRVQVFTDSRRGRQGYVSEITLQRWGRGNPGDDFNRRDNRDNYNRDNSNQNDPNDRGRDNSNQY